MRLAFSSPDIANATLLNPATHRAMYEVLSSPDASNERFTTLRHPAEPGKDRWEGKFVGSIEWGEGLLDDDDRAEEGRDEGWLVWARADAGRKELGSLLRPVDGKGKLARVFNGHMRAEFLWTFKSFKLPHKPAVLQLMPMLSPDPIVTYYPAHAVPARCSPASAPASGSGSGLGSGTGAGTGSGLGLPPTAATVARRSFSLSRSRSRSRQRPNTPPTSSSPSSSSPAAPPNDHPYGYLEISPRALEMLDLVVLTFLIMVLSPQTQAQHLNRNRSLTGRLSLRSPPATAPGTGRVSQRSSMVLSSGEQTGDGDSLPSTPSDTDAPAHGEGHAGKAGPDAKKSWKDILLFRTPSPASISSGLGAGVDKLRRFSFPAVGKAA